MKESIPATGRPQASINEYNGERYSLVSLDVNINDEKDLGLHPINIKTARPGQLSPFNGQLADLREPPPPFSGRNSLTGHKKETSHVPYQCHQPLSSSMPPRGVLSCQAIGGAWPQNLPLKFLLEPQILPPKIKVTNTPNFAL